MGATEGILSPTRLLSTHRRVTLEVITGMRRCETPQMPLPPARCFDDLTALITNTSTVQGTVERRQSTPIEPEREMEEPVILHKKTRTTTVPTIAQTHILTLAASLQTHPMSRGTTGQSTSAPLGRSTITTAGQRSPSGRSLKSGWRESSGRRRPLRLRLLIVSPKTGTTDGRPCKRLQPLASQLLNQARWRSQRRRPPPSRPPRARA